MYQSPDLVKVDLEIKDNYAAYGETCDYTIGYMFSSSCDGDPHYYFNAPAGVGFDADNCWTSPHA